MPKLGLYSSGWSVGETVQFGASDYWRLAVPGRELARNGWQVIPGRSVLAARDGTLQLRDEHGGLHDDCDVVLWQRYMGEGAAEAIRRARAVGQAVVNDLDDHYWALPQSHSARSFTDPRRNPTYNREHYREVISASSLVTVSTPFLARFVSTWGPPVRVLRNYVALDQWPARAPGSLYGWVGVTSWRGADLPLLSRGVVPWLRERGLPFYHGGFMEGGARASTQIGYEKVIERRACEIPLYPRLWDALRVAFVPIEDSTFGRAKSYVKGLEACARGIPFIASDHAEYRELGAGRLARRPRDWARHLDELEDPEVYAAECVANRARAMDLSIERNWREWDSVLREAIARTEVDVPLSNSAV